MKNIYIYLDPFSPGEFIYGEYKFNYKPFYVGMGNKYRSMSHLCESSLNRTPSSLKNIKIRSILNKGIDPIILILHKGLSLDEANLLEMRLISLIGRKYNKTGPLINIEDGGDCKMYVNGVKVGYKKGGNFKPHSERTKQRISEAQMGEKNHQFGKTPSKETREKQRISSSGEKNHFFGKEHSDYTKKLLIDINSIKVEQIDVETLEVINVYDSIKVAGKMTNIEISNIGHCCRGGSIQVKGFYWEFHDHIRKDKFKPKVDFQRNKSRNKFKHFLNSFI
jgi:group I intron endonuclease